MSALFRRSLPGTNTASDPAETEAERLKRNWADILQELRVIQTGTQIITGFLLSAAFSSGFEHLGDAERVVYLCLLVSAIATTAMGLTPVVLHRSLFRQGAKKRLVLFGSRLLVATVVGVGITLTGIALIVFELVGGWTAGIIAASICAAILIGFWVLLPWGVRAGLRRDDAQSQDDGR